MCVAAISTLALVTQLTYARIDVELSLAGTQVSAKVLRERAAWSARHTTQPSVQGTAIILAAFRANE
jgi:hypothetical protein